MPVRLQVRLGLGGDVARVAAVGLVGERVEDREVDDERLLGAERVDVGASSTSGISFMSDSWMAWKPRIDEPSNIWPSVKKSAARLWRRHVEVLHHAGQVAEPDVDELDVLLLDELEDFVGVAEQVQPPVAGPNGRPVDSGLRPDDRCVVGDVRRRECHGRVSIVSCPLRGTDVGSLAQHAPGSALSGRATRARRHCRQRDRAGRGRRCPR